MSMTRSTSASDLAAWRSLLADVLGHPTMYGTDGRYPSVVAFLHGCDAMTGGELLRGFEGWLLDRHFGSRDRPVSLGWEGILNKVVRPRSQGFRRLRRDESARLVDRLASELDAFLEDRHPREGNGRAVA
jgi:hypothetical protein